MEEFLNRINTPSKLKRLPVFHSCDAFSFRSILKDREINTQLCNVYKGENLVYFFYGKPAYRVNDEYNTRLKSFYPISLILKENALEDVKRIMPFDSGAFHFGLFKDYLHPKMTLSDFELNGSMDNTRKIVHYFFDTNKNYFLSNPKKDTKVDPLDFEVESYLELINSKQIQKVDDRKSIIEIQNNSSVSLTADNVLSIIIPDTLLVNPKVESFINELNIEPILYSDQGHYSIGNLENFYSLTEELLSENKLL
ncbi:hypothetical protein [Seonamhaeicola marinus]|uniref:Uncharacterized protein n=1 Tax=Seonamhaeicola marinus TaxID=1912246 RepID=A0A5D0HSQ6_9FLAO|nr:hypothetical protein [Seonamhaeicola marinus]TYA74393.1 hypothetical protein FUA24_13795 [Seonamhaeicola marinus]